MSKAWSFESGALNTLKKSDGLYVKIEISNPQPLANWKTSPATALPAPDFTTGVETVTEFIWNIPEIERVSNVEPGASGLSGLAIEARNSYIGTSGDDVASGSLVEGVTYKVVGYTSVTYNAVTYVTNQYFTATSTATYTTVGTGTVEKYMTLRDVLEVDYANYDLHFRISTKTTSGGSYVVRYWGIVDLRNVRSVPRKADRPDWDLVSFRVEDSIKQLTKISATDWMDATLTHAANDYTATYTYLTFVGDFAFAQQGLSTNYYAGRYLAETVRIKNHDNENVRAYDIDGTTVNRWIKIVDILQSVHNLMGCEATSINNGGSWSDFHSWKFYYNSADSTGTGGETLNAVEIDDLWVSSGLFESGVYVEQYTFFDPTDTGQFSWKRMGDPLEVLKKICESLGMTFRTKVNASGERYMEFVEYGKFQSTKTITSYGDVVGLEFTRNALATSGVEIVSPGSQTGSTEQPSNVVLGDSDTDSLKYDCWFTSTNHLRSNYEFRRIATDKTPFSGARRCAVLPTDTDWFCSLWTLTGITAKAATNAYSICVISPRENATQIPNTAQLPGFAEDYGGSVGVAVPNKTSTDPQYFTFIEAPAMALALYLFSPEDESVNPVGFIRPKGSEIDIDIVGIDHTTVETPPMKLVITQRGKTYNFMITRITEAMRGDAVKYIGHTRGV